MSQQQVFLCVFLFLPQYSVGLFMLRFMCAQLHQRAYWRDLGSWEKKLIGEMNEWREMEKKEGI